MIQRDLGAGRTLLVLLAIGCGASTDQQPGQGSNGVGGESQGSSTDTDIATGTTNPSAGDSDASTGESTEGDTHQGDPMIDSEPFAPAIPGRAVEAMIAFGPGTGYAAAWYEADAVLEPGPAQPDGSCAFSVSRDRGQTWSPVHRRAHPTHPVGANPVVAIDADGSVQAVCMSLERDYSAGVLELSTSTDGGNTWSDWTTIVARTGGFPDKPWITSPSPGVLHLIYTDADFTFAPPPDPPKARTFATLLTSSNGGETWSAPHVLSEVTLDPEPQVAGIIGPSIVSTTDGDAVVSWGEYNQGGIRFTSLQRHLAGDAPIEVVPEVAFEGPITQLNISPDGGQIVILWYPAHDFGPIGIAQSSDGGHNWDVIPEFRQLGAVPVAVIDPQRVFHMIWHERDGDLVRTYYGRTGLLADTDWQISGIELAEYNAAAGSDGVYIGAYQGLAMDDAGDMQALWLTWEPPGSSLVRSRLSR